MAETFYLIDGYSQIMRAYWARFGNLSAPTGEPTKATMIFSRILINLLENKKPTYLAVAMDSPSGAVRRRRLSTAYKEHRDKVPEDLIPQIKRILQILEAAGIPIMTSEGEEADDVIATIVETLRHRDVELYLVSRDKDLFQLIGPKVKLFDPHGDELIDQKRLVQTRGFTREQAVEIQTLMGDKVDNIPGIRNVGLKKATSLIKQFGTAEAVVANAGQLPGKLRENVLEFSGQLSTTRRLVELRRDCPLSFDLDWCRTDRFDLKRAAPIFAELRLKKLLEAISGSLEENAAPAASPGGVENISSLEGEVVKDRNQLAALASKLRKAGTFALDTETTSLRPREAKLVGLSFAWEWKGGTYIPIRSTRGNSIPLEAVRDILGPVFEDPEIQKTGQNLKYDLQTLRGAGIELRGPLFDTMVAAHLVDPARRTNSLDFLARELLNYSPIPISKVIGRGSKQLPIEGADPELLADYAMEDANLAFRLRGKLEPALREEGLEKLFYEVEMPLVRVLSDMEWRGVKLDTSLLKRVSTEFSNMLSGLREQIMESAGSRFNVDSPRQLAEVLFDKLGFPVVKRTKTSRSTDAGVLQTLAASNDHPLPGLVLRYRELAKLKNTYVDVLPELVSPATGRIHTSYHQAKAATGRLSASEPNIQNIPVRTEEGRLIRQAFVAGKPDEVLLTADYSQVELRILAHFCRDEALVTAFERDEDIHNWVASRIWGLSPEEVPGSLRAQAKAVNFGIVYGQTAFGLAKTLGIPRREASEFLNAYRARFPGIARFVDSVIEKARETGEVRTILGRRRPLEDIKSRNRVRRLQAERLAVNSIIQGSAADLIKLSMIKLHNLTTEGSLPAAMLIQVHDELVFEIPEKQARECAQRIDKEMTGALPLSVPLKVDVAWGKSWLEGKG